MLKSYEQSDEPSTEIQELESLDAIFALAVLVAIGATGKQAEPMPAPLVASTGGAPFRAGGGEIPSPAFQTKARGNQ